MSVQLKTSMLATAIVKTKYFKLKGIYRQSSGLIKK